MENALRDFSKAAALEKLKSSANLLSSGLVVIIKDRKNCRLLLRDDAKETSLKFKKILYKFVLQLLTRLACTTSVDVTFKETCVCRGVDPRRIENVDGCFGRV